MTGELEDNFWLRDQREVLSSGVHCAGQTGELVSGQPSQI